MLRSHCKYINNNIKSTNLSNMMRNAWILGSWLSAIMNGAVRITIWEFISINMLRRKKISICNELCWWTKWISRCPTNWSTISYLRWRLRKLKLSNSAQNIEIGKIQLPPVFFPHWENDGFNSHLLWVPCRAWKTTMKGYNEIGARYFTSIKTESKKGWLNIIFQQRNKLCMLWVRSLCFVSQALLGKILKSQTWRSLWRRYWSVWVTMTTVWTHLSSKQNTSSVQKNRNKKMWKVHCSLLKKYFLRAYRTVSGVTLM